MNSLKQHLQSLVAQFSRDRTRQTHPSRNSANMASDAAVQIPAHEAACTATIHSDDDSDDPEEYPSDLTLDTSTLTRVWKGGSYSVKIQDSLRAPEGCYCSIWLDAGSAAERPQRPETV